MNTHRERRPCLPVKAGFFNEPEQAVQSIGKPDLVKLIQEKIAVAGRIPFAEYMELAQYAPGLGYYATSSESIGFQGDFYTSPDLHPLFGEMIARQVRQVADCFSKDPFWIVEMGAGKGNLCRDLLFSLQINYPQVYSRMGYVIVERSRAMVERQKALLSSFIAEKKVRWADGLQDPFFANGAAGIFLSNELLDSFPVHRLVQTGSALKEIYVTLGEGGFSEVLDDPSAPVLSNYFEKLGIRLVEGQQVEVNMKAQDWIRQVGRILTRGVVITIDYGYPASELYASYRPRGTFLCYFKHRVSENPYVRIGLQDMTAHVDFTSVARAGREVGLSVAGFTSQEYFLMGLGMAEAMEARLAQETEPEAREKTLQAMKSLIAPTGLGRAFKVLVQQKGLEGLSLNGLKYKAYGADALFSL